MVNLSRTHCPGVRERTRRDFPSIPLSLDLSLSYFRRSERRANAAQFAAFILQAMVCPENIYSLPGFSHCARAQVIISRGCRVSRRFRRVRFVRMRLRLKMLLFRAVKGANTYSSCLLWVIWYADFSRLNYNYTSQGKLVIGFSGFSVMHEYHVYSDSCIFWVDCTIFYI